MKIKTGFTVTLLLLSAFLITLSSCDNMLIGSGRLEKQEIDVKSFDAIEVSGAFKIYLTQDDTENLVIEADDNIMPHVEARVRGGKLYLGTRGLGFSRGTLNAYISVAQLQSISASGAVKIVTETPLEFRRLEISSSGASDLDLELYGDRLRVKISGAGKSNLEGEVNRTEISMSGASKMNAKSLRTQIMEIDISGAGSATVFVEEELTAGISGAGSVKYHGDPNVKSRISGAGKVSRAK